MLGPELSCASAFDLDLSRDLDFLFSFLTPFSRLILRFFESFFFFSSRLMWPSAFP